MDRVSDKIYQDVTDLLKTIDELNHHIKANDDNRYLRDQFINNRSGYVEELRRILKGDFGLSDLTE